MILSVFFFCAYFVVHGILLFRWLTYQTRVQPLQTGLPYASVLVAVRNEEQNIVRCLQALWEQDYPRNKLEVLIGDDNSNDNTLAVIQEFIKDKPNFHVFSISGRLGEAHAKANVIAHLAREAESNFLLITDADIAVPKAWARTLLAPMNMDAIGVVAGVTTINPVNTFARIQALDWVYSLGLIQVLTEMPHAISALGNNMLVRRDAYESVGGFETIPHSITEDVQLFKYVTGNDWGYANLYQPEALAVSEPAPNLLTVLQQRKRWMTGSMHLPWFAVLPFVLHASFYLVLLTSFYYLSWQAMLGLTVAKLVITFLFLNRGLNRLELKGLLRYLPLFELYLLFLSIVLIPFYYLPVKINWKDRRYKK